MEHSLKETIVGTFTLAESGGLPGTHTNVVDTLLVLLVIVGMRSEG